MKISIITVAYNSESTISDTLRSVAEQNHPNIEYLIIDGASKDRTLAIVEEHGSRVTRVISEPDKGIYDAMNKGLALASGDFVGFLNADDTLASPSTIANMAAAGHSPHIDGIYGDLMYVKGKSADQIVRHWRAGSFEPGKLRFGWMPPHPTLYLRRSSLLQGDVFDSKFRIAADYDFMLRFLSRPGVQLAYLPEILVKMRTGGASNRSLSALLSKSREDLLALRRNQVGGLPTLLCKNLRKLPQFFTAAKA